MQKNFFPVARLIGCQFLATKNSLSFYYRIYEAPIFDVANKRGMFDFILLCSRLSQIPYLLNSQDTKQDTRTTVLDLNNKCQVRDVLYVAVGEGGGGLGSIVTARLESWEESGNYNRGQ